METEMKRERVSPPYRAYALLADGSRRPLEAHGVIVELRPGIEVEIDLAPHPGWRGQLVMLTPPPPEMERVQKQGIFDDFVTFFGGSNVLHVWVERRDRSAQASPAPAPAVRPRKPKRRRKNSP
jgi:hypothetical protein